MRIVYIILLFSFYLKVAGQGATTTDNVECNCRKVLAAAKLAEDKPADFPGGGAIAFQKLYSSPYPANGGFSFEDVKNKCCELFNTGNNPPKDCPKAFEIGQPFSTAARQEIANQLGNNNITDALSDINCTPDQEVPCMKDLDTCGCNKLQTEYAAWMAHPVYKPNGTAPVSFEVFLKINTGLTISNATELKDKCFELFMKGVAKDKNGNAVRGYVPGNPSGWWSKSAQSNLKQEVQDKKISDHMIIPEDWSCNPGCTEPLPPCPKRLSPCMLKFVFSAFIANEWFKEISGQPRYEAMGVGTFSEVDEYMGTVLEWTDQYDTYLSNNTTPTDPTDAARVAMLQLLFDQLKGYYLENTCLEDRVSPVTLEFLMKKMLGCGNGNVIVENPCTVSMTCADFGAVLQTLLISHNWPGFSGSSYSNAGDYALEFEYWYYTYLAKKANNTHTQDEEDWADVVLNQLNAEYNSCYPTTLLEMKEFIKRIWNCRPLPRPAGTQASPCPSCYAPNMEWLEALQTFISQVAQKSKPDFLTNYSFYLKPNNVYGVDQSKFEFQNFYNSVLYQNGTDQENLIWNLNEDYQGGKLMPGMRTLIKDNNGFKLDMSLDWPTEEARWNFNYIQNFINIRPIKTKGCGQPKYFYVDVVYKVPVDYVQPGNAFGYVNNYPQPFVEYCLDTVTLIGKIWESSNGLNVSKQVPCLGCNKLCNRPIATLAIKAEDPCEEDKKVAIYNATLRFNAHIQARAAYFDSMYRNTCFGAQDRLEAEYDLNQYHYTLYYYDQAGQLIKTVPPAGVDIDNNQLSNADRQLLANDRIATAWAHMNNNSMPRANMYHGLITNYKYYTGGQLAWQHTPDGGESRFWYDNLGRIVLSQNANQKDEGTYSFTEFDALGRPKMAGELDPSSSTYLVDDYHIGFEDGQEGYSFYSQEDGISITRPSGKPDFKFFYTPGSYNKRLKIATNTASATPECHISGFVLSPVQTYTLSFFGELKGTLSQFNYQIKDNVSTYVNTSFTGGPHTVSHSINLASGSNGQLEIIFTSTSSGATEYFEIDDIRITHSETAIPAASPRRAAQNSWLADFRNTGTKTQVVQTWFDAIPTAASAEFTGLLNNGQGNNLRNRVAFTTNEDVYDGNDATYTHGTAYSYDIHGNAERIVQNIPSLKHLGVNLYTLDYDYVLISGKVSQVDYQTGKKDQWMHRYEYDADNRLVRAYTSRDGYIWERDAKYFYYLHGPLGRTELGELQVQGIDNTYTLHGWIHPVKCFNIFS